MSVLMMASSMTACGRSVGSSSSREGNPAVNSTQRTWSTNSTTQTTSGAGTSTSAASSTQKEGIETSATAQTVKPVAFASYKIVLAKQATVTEKNAALELQKYLKAITGASLPIITDDQKAGEAELVIGKTSREKNGMAIERSGLGSDGFVIKRFQNSVVIAGGEERGTLYGVYDFLERYFGYRFYAKGVEKIPKKAAASVNLPTSINVREVPDFVYRGIDWYNTFDLETTTKLRINDSHNREKYGDFDSWGGLIDFAGGLFVHTMGMLVPASRYFDEHPEYFSLNLVDGQMVRTKNQRCLTNPNVLQICIDTLRKFLDANPDCKYVAVSQNDVVAPCLCENCAKIDEEEGSQAGSMLRFVNMVADALKKDYPNVTFLTEAYFYTTTPPKITKPRDNVLIRYCAARNCCSHPLESDTYATTQMFRQNLETWATLTDELWIWDYTTNFGHYLAPFPNLFTLQPNLQYLKKNKVTGYFAQGNYQGNNGEFGELRSYLLARLMWDTEQDLDTLMNDFLENYYGAGWKSIRQYIDEYRAQSANFHLTSTINNAPQDSMPSDSPKLATEFVEKMDDLWEAAEKAAKGEAVQRVQRSRLQIRYYKQLVTKTAYYDQGTAAQRAQWVKDNETLYNYMKSLNVLHNREGKLVGNIDFEKSPDTW